MSDQQAQKLQPEWDKGNVRADNTDSGSKPSPISPPQKLTPEEQMALYEKSLKEDDWGHQPC